MNTHHGVFFVFGLVAVVALGGFVVVYDENNVTAEVFLPHEVKHTSTEYKSCGAGKVKADVNFARMLRDKFHDGVDHCVFRQDLNAFCCDTPTLSISVN